MRFRGNKLNGKIQDGELQIENEIEEAPPIEFEISVSPSDPTLELLSTQLERDDIIIPVYQRRFVWSIEQSSKLIESFLMGLPVPQIFLYVNEDNILEVIDGQQRILSIYYFFNGFFDEADEKDRRKIFKLKGLSSISEYNGKTFQDLTKSEQRKLRNTTLRTINIKQISPQKNTDCVFHIFERLNTGGTQLRAQEIRNAVCRGKIIEELQGLNGNEAWLKILGLKSADKHQRDVELVLRLMSLFKNWNNYEKPMLKFLNEEMNKNKNFNTANTLLFKEKFNHAVTLISTCIKRPFRPKGVINMAFLEAVFISIMELEPMEDSVFIDRYNTLLSEKKFMNLISGPTTDTAVLKNRINLAKTILSGNRCLLTSEHINEND